MTSRPRNRRNATKPDKSKILHEFSKLGEETKQLIAGITKGITVLVLRLRVMDLLTNYSSITVRMLFYRLVSLFDYPNDRRFYKNLQYSLKRLRKLFPEMNMKFEDPTRPIRIPKMPNPKIELWSEKSSLEFFLMRLAEKYHVPSLGERGFGSLTIFTKAIERARKRGVRKILFISDHDPSGLMIDEVTRRELPIKVERIALTLEQIKKYHLPSIRVKRKDSRARNYMERFGDNGWEVEALHPKALLRIVEQKLVENIPREFLKELRIREKVEKVTRPLEEKLIERIRGEAVKLKKKGISDEEIIRRLAEEFAIGGM